MSQLSITVAFSLRAKWHFISAALLIKKSGCITETSSVWLQCFVPVVWERAICCFVFFQLDPENTGFIAVENFTSLVEHHELQLDPSKLDMLLALVQSNEEGQVCYQELIELVSEKTRCTHIHTLISYIQRCRGSCMRHSMSCSTETNFHTYTHFCWISEKVTELIQTEPASSTVAKIDLGIQVAVLQKEDQSFQLMCR